MTQMIFMCFKFIFIFSLALKVLGEFFWFEKRLINKYASLNVYVFLFDYVFLFESFKLHCQTAKKCQFLQNVAIKDHK